MRIEFENPVGFGSEAKGSVLKLILIELVKEKQIEEFERQGLTDSQIEQAVEMSEMFMTPGMIGVMAFIGMLLIGLVLGLIVSAIVKNPRPIFD